jgi:transposase InsO family protein
MNKRWHLDLFALPLAPKNRRVFLVLLVDDDSHFVVGFGLYRRMSAARVLRVLRTAIASYGAPREILLDHGLHYELRPGHGQRRIITELSTHSVKSVVATAKHAAVMGKCERVFGTVLRECVGRTALQDLVNARRRLVSFFRYYNDQRRHRSLGGLAPADRFSGAAHPHNPSPTAPEPSASDIEQEVDDE